MRSCAASAACAFALACSGKEPPRAAPDAGALANLDAIDQMQEQLKDRPKTFEVLCALGNLYYENGRYLDAVDAFRQALAISAPLEARAQELRDRKVQPAKDLPLECRRSGQE